MIEFRVHETLLSRPRLVLAPDLIGHKHDEREGKGEQRILTTKEINTNTSGPRNIERLKTIRPKTSTPSGFQFEKQRSRKNFKLISHSAVAGAWCCNAMFATPTVISLIIYGEVFLASPLRRKLFHFGRKKKCSGALWSVKISVVMLLDAAVSDAWMMKMGAPKLCFWCFPPPSSSTIATIVNNFLHFHRAPFGRSLSSFSLSLFSSFFGTEGTWSFILAPVVDGLLFVSRRNRIRSY